MSLEYHVKELQRLEEEARWRQLLGIDELDAIIRKKKEEERLRERSKENGGGRKSKRQRRKKSNLGCEFNSHNKQDNSYRRNCENRHYDRHDKHSYKRSSDRHDKHKYSNDRHDIHDRHDTTIVNYNVDNSYQDYSVKHVYKGSGSSAGELGFFGGLIAGGLTALTGVLGLLGGSSDD